MDIVKNIQRTHEVSTPTGPVGPKRPGGDGHTAHLHVTSTPMAASRSISDGALTSRERPHERHYGYTRSDGTDEHSASSFPCSFWVVSGLMYKPCHGHTQNEQFIRPHRLCQVSTADQNLDAQMAALQAAPWSTPRPATAPPSQDVPNFEPSSISSIPARRWWSRASTAWRARCVISRSLSRHSRTRAPISPPPNSRWTPRPLPARRSSTCSASLPSSRPTCAASARSRGSPRRSNAAPIAAVHPGSTWKPSSIGWPSACSRPGTLSSTWRRDTAGSFA